MLPRVAILCGGRGTRLQEHAQSIPKPLVEIGGRPILWHVIQIYLAQGFREFALLTGYKAELIEGFVGRAQWPADASVQCVQTGVETPTGGRLRLAAEAIDGERFCVTYADGVADIDLRALLAEHDRHRARATMTVVRPELQFGVAELNGEGVVRGFVEKPRSQHWVNGGFFCFEPSVLEVLREDSVLEREPLAELARRGELRAYRHDGFWDCMDTYKDAVLLNDLWAAGRAPWKLSELNGHSVLVTGAYGLLGSWLVKRLLEADATVVTLRRDDTVGSPLQLMGLAGRVNVVHGDICTPGLVARALGEYEVNSVFHLAAQTIVPTANRGPESTFETNIRGTWMLLEACRHHGAGHVVVASSDKAYGPHAELPYREDFALQPRYPYDASKAAADLLARSYWHTWQLPVAVTRFANLYGGGDTNRSRLIPEAVVAALAGRSPIVRSDGSPERDFLYVEDAVAAYLAIWQALRAGAGAGARVAGEAFNAGGGRSHRVLDVVELVCRLAGTGVTPDVRGTGTPAGEIDRQWVDYSKLNRLTGWAPSVTLEEGLRRTLDWHRRFG